MTTLPEVFLWYGSWLPHTYSSHTETGTPVGGEGPGVHILSLAAPAPTRTVEWRVEHHVELVRRISKGARS
ncbi:MAG: hypothetical protein ACRDS0_17395 [Pseudonocardiaceae bacterium]